MAEERKSDGERWKAFCSSSCRITAQGDQTAAVVQVLYGAAVTVSTALTKWPTTLNGPSSLFFSPLVTVTFFHFEISTESNLLSFLLLPPLIFSLQSLHFYFYHSPSLAPSILLPHWDRHSSVPNSFKPSSLYCSSKDGWVRGRPRCGVKINSKHSKWGQRVWRVCESVLCPRL